MRLKKRILAIVAVVLVVGLATYFGSTVVLDSYGEVDDDDSRDYLFGGKRDKETIHFWYTDDNMTSFFNSAAVSFGEKKEVRVMLHLVSGSEFLEAVNRASLGEEQQAPMPDVYMITHESLEKAYLAGLASELEDKIGACSQINFPETALDAVSYHGKKVAYPFSFETSALVYNETYLEVWARQQAERELVAGDEESGGDLSADPETANLDEEQVAALAEEYFAQAIPATVDDILEIADTFDAPEGVEIMKWDVSSISYNYWFVGNYMIVGGNAGDDEENLNIDNQETIDCLEVYKALNQFFSIETDSISYESVIEDFIDGKMVFTVGTPDVIKRLEEAKADGSYAYEFGIAPMPDVSDKLKSRSMSVTEAVAVNGYSEHKELANEFAAYLVTESARELYAKTGKIPANILADVDDGAVQMFKVEYAESISMPKMMETGNFWLRLEALFAKVWDGGDVPKLVHELANRIRGQAIAL